jgi:universal stress protein E
MNMTRSIRRILVAVKDVRRRSPALVKAASLAKSLGASVELFHAISEPLVIDALLIAGENIVRYEDQQHAYYTNRLEALAKPLRHSGLTVTTAAEWDFPAHQAVVRRAHLSNADLIVADRHESRHVAPWVLRYNDWELLRNSPVPVLLVKTRRKYDSVKILAAIDPSHALGKTSDLDAAILRVANEVSTKAKGQLHAIHAFVPSLTDVPAAELTRPDASAQIVNHARAHAERRFDKALRAARLGNLPAGRRHLVARHPVDAILLLAKAQRPDIVVMGLAHSGLKGFFIGNTAGRLLDDLPCDLLIVKPPEFVSHVPARSRGPQLIALGMPSGSF